MSNEIKVLVASHGVGRNLVMYYIDPVTERRGHESAPTDFGPALEAEAGHHGTTG